MFLRPVLLTAALVSMPAFVCAHDDHFTPPPVYPEVDQHRPTPLPDRIVLTWSGDPATTQSVTWRTDTSIKRAKAQLALATEHAQASESEVPATTAVLKTDLNTVHIHSVDFTDLQPATLYAYRVGDGVNWSEWFHFRTAKAEAAPFTFIYFGDAQNDVRTHWSRVFREAVLEAPRAAFTLHAGDLINRANRDAEWGEWFAAPAWVNATIPVVATPGNHEYAKLEDRDDSPRMLSGHWRPQFALPLNGPAGLEETVYWFDYQGVRFIALNSNEKQESQIAWLRDVLRKNPQRWTVVTFHHPVFSPAKNRDNPALRAWWKPVLDEFKIDLVLTGHDHTYARTGDTTTRPRVGMDNVPAGYNQAYDPSIGTVYVVSVSGPKMYDITTDAWAVRTAEDTQLFQIVTIDGDELRFEARTATNRLYDQFVLKKRDGRPNELIEAQPPERRRAAKKP